MLFCARQPLLGQKPDAKLEFLDAAVGFKRSTNNSVRCSAEDITAMTRRVRFFFFVVNIWVFLFNTPGPTNFLSCLAEGMLLWNICHFIGHPV